MGPYGVNNNLATQTGAITCFLVALVIYWSWIFRFYPYFPSEERTVFMKRWIALLLALVCLLSLCACGDDSGLDSGSKNSRPEESTPVPTTTKGEESEYVTVYLPAEKAYASGESYHYTYDEDGNKIGYIVCEDGEEDYRYTYTYDENANLLETIGHKDGVAVSRVTYTYDEKGKLLEMSHDGDGGVIYRTTYAYDEKGNEIESVRYKNDVETVRYTCAYDEKGNQTEFVHYDDGEEDYRYTYVYDHKGNLIEETYYNEGNEEEYITYSYDEKANTVTKKTYRNSLTERILTELQIETYDDQSHVIRSEVHILEGEAYEEGREPDLLMTCVYEGDNQLEEKVYSNGQLTYHQKCTYNQQGDLTSELEIYYNDGHEDRRPEYTYEYSYDEAGNITQKKKYRNGELEEDDSFTCTYVKVVMLRKYALKHEYI